MILLSTLTHVRMQEEELKRAIERAELAEAKLKGIEEELQAVGECFLNSGRTSTIVRAPWRNSLFLQHTSYFVRINLYVCKAESGMVWLYLKLYFKVLCFF